MRYGDVNSACATPPFASSKSKASSSICLEVDMGCTCPSFVCRDHGAYYRLVKVWPVRDRPWRLTDRDVKTELGIDPREYVPGRAQAIAKLMKTLGFHRAMIPQGSGQHARGWIREHVPDGWDPDKAMVSRIGPLEALEELRAADTTRWTGRQRDALQYTIRLALREHRKQILREERASRNAVWPIADGDADKMR
jgi:hypothetical protein